LSKKGFCTDIYLLIFQIQIIIFSNSVLLFELYSVHKVII
jgi:hypothetical protein